MTQDPQTDSYHLDDQVGFLLRQVNQRHLAIFAKGIPDLTPTQFAALAKLCELGKISQNALGRATAMDAATIKGVADRLRKKGYVTAAPDPKDQRRQLLSPSDQGRAAFADVVQAAHHITAETLTPLTDKEQVMFITLLRKMTGKGGNDG